MTFDAIDRTQTQAGDTGTATDTAVTAPPQPLGKKRYNSPALAKYGKVSKLTAAISGSNTDALGGDQIP